MGQCFVQTAHTAKEVFYRSGQSHLGVGLEARNTNNGVNLQAVAGYSYFAKARHVKLLRPV